MNLTPFFLFLSNLLHVNLGVPFQVHSAAFCLPSFAKRFTNNTGAKSSTGKEGSEFDVVDVSGTET